MTHDPDLFRRARESVDIIDWGGTTMVRAGKRWRGECPICHSGKGKTGHYSVDRQKQIFFCFGCEKGGDVIGLEHYMNSSAEETKADAARRILGEDRVYSAPRPARAPVVKAVSPGPEKPGWTMAYARELWTTSLPAAGTIVERYLEARGIHGRVLRQALKRVRFVPMAYHSGDPRHAVAHPAMIVRVFAPAGSTGAVHATYLKRDGSGKAVIDDGSAKIMWGPQSRDGLPGGAWLTHFRDDGPLVVGEGIESTLSLACLLDRPCRVAVALALNRLQGGWLEDKLGMSDPACPRSDPSRPAFTWPEPIEADADQPPAPWGRIYIGVDHDMKPIRKTVPGLNRRPVERMLTATERAQVCGALAAASWARTTDAPVEVMIPPVGKDWNNVLLEGLRET